MTRNITLRRWPLWLAFMFSTPVRIRGEAHRTVFSRLERIPRAKYPALSEDEAACSVPLQALLL